MIQTVRHVTHIRACPSRLKQFLSEKKTVQAGQAQWCANKSNGTEKDLIVTQSRSVSSTDPCLIPKSPTCCARLQPRRLASNLRERHREAYTTRPAIQHVSLSRTFFGETTKAVSMAYLKSAWVTELRIGEQVLQLVSGLDAANLVRIPGSENLRDIGIVPGLDVIIARFPSVNVSLNGVTFVADDESVDV